MRYVAQYADIINRNKMAHCQAPIICNINANHTTCTIFQNIWILCFKSLLNLELSKTQKMLSQFQLHGLCERQSPPDGCKRNVCASRQKTAGEGRWGLQSLLITSSWQRLLCSCFTPSAHSQERHVGWSAWQTRSDTDAPSCTCSVPRKSQPFSTSYPPISWQRDGTCQLLLATLTRRTQFINGDRDWGIMLRIEKLDQISGINQLRPVIKILDINTVCKYMPIFKWVPEVLLWHQLMTLLLLSKMI